MPDFDLDAALCQNTSGKFSARRTSVWGAWGYYLAFVPSDGSPEYSVIWATGPSEVARMRRRANHRNRTHPYPHELDHNGMPLRVDYSRWLVYP